VFVLMFPLIMMLGPNIIYQFVCWSAFALMVCDGQGNESIAVCGVKMSKYYFIQINSDILHKILA